MTRPTRRALLVVAHPDDETFGTGSVIANLAAAGVEVVVCCATRGEMGEAHGVPEGADLGAVREAELRAAGAILGVADFVLLGYLDSGMTGDLAEDSLVGAPLEDVVGRVRAVVEDVDPELVITLDPVNSDGHRDHVRIGAATTEACRGRAGTRSTTGPSAARCCGPGSPSSPGCNRTLGCWPSTWTGRASAGRTPTSRRCSTSAPSATCANAPAQSTAASGRRWPTCRNTWSTPTSAPTGWCGCSRPGLAASQERSLL